MEFERLAVVGAGAVGASIVAMLCDAGRQVAVLADGPRAQRLRDGLIVNGRCYRPAVDDLSQGPPYDLVIVATKSTQLESALPLVATAAGSYGYVISLLNGISSEGIIRSALERHASAGPAGAPSVTERVIPAMILGIDAMRVDEGFVFLNRGTIYYGADPQTAPVPIAALDALGAVLAGSEIPAVRSEQITRTLWWKFMINVGINQSSAVLRAPYGLFQRSRYAQALMVDAMREVIALSRAEGAGLEERDIDQWIETLRGLNPDGKTSMVQDVEAGKPTEVDLFAGTVLEIAEKHGLDAPVNRTLYRLIRAMEG